MNTATITTETRRYVDTYGTLDVVSTVDTAKVVRKALKAAFPGVKFTVRARAYHSMFINWTDGPKEREVEEITNQFIGIVGERSMCGDYYTSKQYIDNGHGAHYDLMNVLCWRAISDETLEAATQSIIEASGMGEQEFVTMWKGDTKADWTEVENVLSKVQNTYGQGAMWGQLFASKFVGHGLVRLAKMVAANKSYNA